MGLPFSAWFEKVTMKNCYQHSITFFFVSSFRFHRISTTVSNLLPNSVQTYEVSFQTFFVCYCYTSYEMTKQFFMISGSNELLQQELEYTLLKPDCHSWWISKVQSGREVSLEEQYAIKLCFKLGKKCHRNVWNTSDCFWTILHESSIRFWVV